VKHHESNYQEHACEEPKHIGVRAGIDLIGENQQGDTSNSTHDPLRLHHGNAEKSVE
jgi:hypothetical protein